MAETSPEYMTHYLNHLNHMTHYIPPTQMSGVHAKNNIFVALISSLSLFAPFFHRLQLANFLLLFSSKIMAKLFIHFHLPLWRKIWFVYIDLFRDLSHSGMFDLPQLVFTLLFIVSKPPCNPVLCDFFPRKECIGGIRRNPYSFFLHTPLCPGKKPFDVTSLILYSIFFIGVGSVWKRTSKNISPCISRSLTTTQPRISREPP